MIIGHENIIEDLKRLAAEKQLAHGYIFFGPAMAGKRMAALAFAKFLEKGAFEETRAGEILQDAKMIDLAYTKQLNPDTKDSIGIDAVREIVGFLGQKPNASARRTLIIDDAELLTTEAQNAILKIAEEPPPSALLILTTSDIDGLLPTISSRLQKIYFGAVPQREISDWLAAEYKIAKKAADELAGKSFGKPGLAARLLNDEKLAENLKLAEKFLKTSIATRRDFIKILIEPEDFNFRNFLDAVIMNLSWARPELSRGGGASANRTALWHKVLKLRENISNFSLNPRLQLENLLTS